jgi:hypothetical protein
MISWKDVHSEMVERIGYSAYDQELHVKWRRTGRVSIYEGVPPDVANQAMTAWSVGEYLNENVKPVYGHRYEK